ncbi:MAG: radical SAM protein [Candidatus Heimdallarchaeaceae archaeon]
MISKVLILPVGLTCNLRCGYCVNNNQRSFSNSKAKIMSEEMLYRIFNELKPVIDKNKPLTIIWHGGEPTLAGIEFYKSAVEMEKKVFGDKQIKNGIQTNATLINDDWCRFFKKEDFRPSTSLDGPAYLHNRLRVDVRGEGTYDKVIKSYKLMKSYGLRVGSLGVITPKNVDYPEQIVDWLIENNISSWDFLLCAEPPESDSGLTLSNKKSINFSIRLFDEWFKRDKPEIRIRTFRIILKTELGGEPDICSWKLGCLNFVSFDSFGNAYLCAKFHAHPETSYGNVMKNSLEEILKSPKVKAMHKTISESQKKCQSCEWLSACGGGCSFVKYTLYKKFDAPFIHCEVRQAMFKHIAKKIRGEI